jgi:DeoR family glycerol-3-phosphate regulon repressor
MIDGLIDAISERQAQIAERVRQRGFQTVAELAQHFDVTTQTIRRDIAELCDLGVLKRRHGGAELPVPGANLGFGERQILNQAAKEAIARTVVRHIPNGASIAVSIGTTPEIVVRHLVRHSDLKLFTNNLMAAIGACAIRNAEVHIPGGQVRAGARDVLGAEAEGFFARFKVDIGLYGVGGVDADGQLLDFREEEIRVREAIRANCRAAYLVLDGSKFGRPAHVRGGYLTEADLVFSDATPPAGLLDRISGGGGRFVLCADEGPAA